MGATMGRRPRGNHILPGAAAALHPPCPAPCPTPHRHPGVRGHSTSPALPLKIENLKTLDFHSAKNSRRRLGAGAQGTLAPTSPCRGRHRSAVGSGGLKGTGVLMAVRTPGSSPAPTGPVCRGSRHELWDQQRLPAGIVPRWGPSADPLEAVSPGSCSHAGTICGRSCPIAAAWLPLPRLPFAFSQLYSTLLLKIPREMRAPDGDSARPARLGERSSPPGAPAPWAARRDPTTLPWLVCSALTLAWPWSHPSPALQGLTRGPGTVPPPGHECADPGCCRAG